jgi:hypothetical protein
MESNSVELVAKVSTLSTERQRLLTPMVEALQQEFEVERPGPSWLATDAFVESMGATLQLHHALSRESFTKDKFEYAMERILQHEGHAAELAGRGNPGHDITVDGEAWSLKTQADRTIKTDQVTISKFMELGKGRWEDESDLTALRARMIEHMQSYERIFTLRCLTPESDEIKQYELVEIPKTVLISSQDFPCEMKYDSRQTPKPGYCKVTIAGKPAFELYFDGGTERKLQVRKLQLTHCDVHARWTIKV